MNKSRKNIITEGKDLSAFSMNYTPLRLTTKTASQLPELNWEASPTWKPLRIDPQSEKENTNWFSMIYDLLHTLEEMAGMLEYEIGRKSWLNAYLLAAGMNQIAEDYLHPDPFHIGKASKYLRKLPQPTGALLANSAQAAAKFLKVLNELKPVTRRVITWQHRLTRLVNELADVVTGEELSSLFNDNRLVAEGEAITAQLHHLPAQLRGEVIRLPSCFRSFDQQPEDLKGIVDQFSIQWPDHDRQITVIGIRTSGSYLAPLYAAIIKAHGYQKVSMLTIRPGNPLTDSERAALNHSAHVDGLALLCDDPPITGSTVVKAGNILEQVGFPAQNIILLLQLFGDSQTLPDSLRKLPSVLLPWNDWSIHQRLELKAVQAVLSNTCEPPFQISNLVRLPFSLREEKRDHVCALYQVKLLNLKTSQSFTRLVRVKGIGLGYFGEHALAVAQRLSGYSAQLIAFQDDLTYEEVISPTRQLTSVNAKEAKWVDNLVDYILERNRRLPAREDISLRLTGRNTVWEVASNQLSKAFSRGWLVARIPLIDPYVKDLLRPAHPSIIDGDMALKNWYTRENIDTPLVKMNLAERDFSHMDLSSYDPVYDLAGLSLEVENDKESTQLRRKYEALSGDKVTPERWLLYQLVHLWDQNRQETSELEPASRRMANVTQGYFSEIYFQNLHTSTNGAICALDVDGVLETNQLGFPSLSTSSAKSLHALASHGYRVILATGRSLEDVKERCAAYHLAGGVAEYGSVLYDHTSVQVLPILSEAELGTLYRLRGRLSNTSGIHLDPEYRFAVRACRLDKGGKHKGLSNELIARVLDESGLSGRVYAIQGEAQTDFMVTRVNKGYGLQAWLAHFDPVSDHVTDGSSEPKPINLAVGDGSADLSLLALAQQAFAPAHASLEVRQTGVQITSRPYQRGLEQAVTSLLGHKPGGCPICLQETFSWETRFLQDLFSVQENGPMGMLWQAIKLYMRKASRFHVST